MSPPVSARAVIAALVALLFLAHSPGWTVPRPSGGADSLGPQPGDEEGPSQVVVANPTDRPEGNWPFSTGPTYGVVKESRRRDPGVLHTQVGSFDMSVGTPPFPPELTTISTLDRDPGQYFVLQVDPASFTDGTFTRLRGTIESLGGALIREMPVAGFVVRLNADAYGAILGWPGMLVLEPYHPAFKLSPYIGRVPLEDPVKALSETFELEVLLFPGEDARRMAVRLEAVGGHVLRVDGDTLRVELHRSRLAALASLEGIWVVFERRPRYVQAEETTATVQTGGWNRGALPYHGAGIDGGGNGLPGTSPQVLMVLDTGFELDACDLSDPATLGDTPAAAGPGHRKVEEYRTVNAFGGAGDLSGCDAYGMTHGHVVASAALGNASRVPDGAGEGCWATVSGSTRQWAIDGVAPGARLAAYDAQLTPPQAPCSAELTPGNLYLRGSAPPAGGSLRDAHDNEGARTFNLSWGQMFSPVYASDAYDIDQFLYDEPSATLFVSAGNGGDSGEMTVSTPATCKSCITVGTTGNANDRPVRFVGPSAGVFGGLLWNPGNQEDRLSFSSMGPATSASERIAPILMAPGADFGRRRENMGPDSELRCRSEVNGTGSTVECSIEESDNGTSFASAAAAGAGMLVRDYFAQGFHPDGTSSNPSNAADQVLDVSGALVKAVLVASADWVGRGNAPGGNLRQRYRFNNEQGYGRIQLNNVLPLDTYSPTASGLMVCDGGLGTSGVCTTSLAGEFSSSGGTQTTVFNVADPDQELRCALAWTEDAGDTLQRDLDLELVSPSAKTYFGNYFTDDNDRDGVLDTGEDCPGFDGSTGSIDESPWSLPACGNSVRDTRNPVEAIFLSFDPDANGPEGSCSVTETTSCFNDGDCPPGETCDGSLSQIETGDWTLRIRAPAMSGPQRYAVACAGAISAGSRIQDTEAHDGSAESSLRYCNNEASVTVLETDDGDDPALGLNTGEIASRVLLQILAPGSDGGCDAPGDLLDEEIVEFTQPDPNVLRFVSNPILFSAYTGRDSGNDVLDIDHGDCFAAIYRDKSLGSYDSDLERKTIRSIDCALDIEVGSTRWASIGRDSLALIRGGCERDARGLFTFDYPDRYMDAGEHVSYSLLFESLEHVDLDEATASLQAVGVDADSPEGCRPGTAPEIPDDPDTSDRCPDPDRENNPVAPQLTILESEQKLGLIPHHHPISVTFGVQVASVVVGEPEIEMVLRIGSETSGQFVEGIAVSRHILDVDEFSLFYSTDYPIGGTEHFDLNNDEILDNPITDPADPDLDLRSESFDWSDMTAGRDENDNPVSRNTSLSAPWSFDSNDGGFVVGLSGWIDASGVGDVIANWGEDQDFDGVLDGYCQADPKTPCNIFPNDVAACGLPTPACISIEDRDPFNYNLDNNWSTLGGCGWQTTDGVSLTGGVWHTGRIDYPGQPTCLTSGGSSGDCQEFETLSGTYGANAWYELLLTPTVEKVNQQLDTEGRPVYWVELLDFAWNMAIDLPDSLSAFTWEIDMDFDSDEAVDLVNDGDVLGVLTGPFGAVSGGPNTFTDGFPLFSDFDLSHLSTNGVVGNNREGDNGCFFENATTLEPLALAAPPDDDDDNDADMSYDEHVETAGPIRNMSVTKAGGPDLRYVTQEDLSGEPGNAFQAAFGFFVAEGTVDLQPTPGFGVAIDDVVLRWRESRLDPDATECGSGGYCAVLYLHTAQIFGGAGAVEAVVIDTSRTDNDCDGDGTPDVPSDVDCDDDGARDVIIHASTAADPDPDPVLLNETSPGSNEYRGRIPVSVLYDSPGTVFLGSREGSALVHARYEDLDDGSPGPVTPCENSSESSRQGFVEASTEVLYTIGTVVVTGWRATDNGDGDGIPDTNETVNLYLSLHNKTVFDLEDVVVRLATDDPEIECISVPEVVVGDLGAGETLEIPDPLIFKVSDSATRTDVDEELSARFVVSVSSAQFDAANTTEVVLDLDLNVAGGAGNITFSESFETTGLGGFESMPLDAGKNSNEFSDDYRCQYSDPDFANANSYGDAFCYLGFDSSPDVFHWHRHDNVEPYGGRAFAGDRSLHFGLHLDSDPALDTTPLSQLEAVRLTSPIHLGWDGVSPILSFKHQVSLMDSRAANVPIGQTVDRAVVQVQLANAGGTAVGDWITIEPYHNIYDSQATGALINCMFDPTDDGTTEDDFFDPTDPFRRLGPSSTCGPRYVFANQGDTDYRFGFSPNALGRASDGPGLEGNLGPGTWVETRFSLDRFRGRSVRMRFLMSTMKAQDTADYGALGFPPDVSADDGWYIDDVQVSGTLSTAASVSVDTTNNTGLPACGSSCTSVTPSITAEPSATAAPGTRVILDGSVSSADGCPNGILQFQFWIDEDTDGELGEPLDTLVRDFTDEPILAIAPMETADYGVRVQCSSDTGCWDDDTTTVTVDCPVGFVDGHFPEPIRFADRLTIVWDSELQVDAVRGDLNALRSYMDFSGTVHACVAEDLTATSLTIGGATPSPGTGYYYLVRTIIVLCNEVISWSTGALQELPDRDTEIGSDVNSCSP